ncbi:MAG TPA: hypothetical protein VM621_10380 [Luteibacter sp.]|uniref:DUF7666 domain-containing protein n=1 Tax=Luteibacter sp. TaxID=1886636 RepID=UPI002BFF76F3|nr:hypothetical protein [Luteibacter sp.]HVI55445.1 hypothetical protein [Luteibacter sp.]
MAKKKETPSQTIVSYKGFDENFQCRGYQYEIGKEYLHEGSVEVCANGFHTCEYPLHVLRYYKPCTSRFAIVEQGGELSRHGDDTKVASSKITVKAEINLAGLIKAAIEYTTSRAKPATGSSSKAKNGSASNSGNYGAATASGYSGAATASGYSGAATASGNYGAATASGNYGAATASGNYGAATASGYYGAATASGYSGAATASGYSGAATASGDYGAATASGDYGAATASGNSGKVRGKEGCALFLAERNDNRVIVAVWAGIAGHDGIKPDTWYRLTNGKPVEVN